jgi:hypothetical protein
MRSLTARDLDRFLKALAARIPVRARIIVTRGIEARILGGTRPTADIDFGLVLRPADEHAYPELEEVVRTVAEELSVVVQFSSDIDRWSSIAIPPRRFRTRPYRRIGRLSVHLLDPVCWAVYKLARYRESDIDDLVAVLKREKVAPLRLATLCGAGLRSSPRSTALHSFRKQVEHFFRKHGPVVWGHRFDPDHAIGRFHRDAGITRN